MTSHLQPWTTSYLPSETRTLSFWSGRHSVGMESVWYRYASSYETIAQTASNREPCTSSTDRSSHRKTLSHASSFDDASNAPYYQTLYCRYRSACVGFRCVATACVCKHTHLMSCCSSVHFLMVYVILSLNTWHPKYFPILAWDYHYIVTTTRHVVTRRAGHKQPLTSRHIAAQGPCIHTEVPGTCTRHQDDTIACVPSTGNNHEIVCHNRFPCKRIYKRTFWLFSYENRARKTAV